MVVESVRGLQACKSVTAGKVQTSTCPFDREGEIIWEALHYITNFKPDETFVIKSIRGGKGSHASCTCILRSCWFSWNNSKPLYIYDYQQIASELITGPLVCGEMLLFKGLERGMCHSNSFTCTRKTESYHIFDYWMHRPLEQSFIETVSIQLVAKSGED
jgi:hypothetical protein